jgi:hypothetical protein
MAVMVLPGKTFIDRIHIRSDLSELVSIVREARVQAMTESSDCTVMFKDRIIQLTSSQGTKEQSLPASLSLKETITVGFNSAGHPIESGTIVLQDTKGKEYRISVAVGTGRVRLY